MKKLILCCGLASAMLATNCSKDDVSEPTGSQPKATITASIEQQEEDSESRTSLSSGNILWADGDAIRLVNQTNTANSDVFTLTGGKGTTNGTISDLDGKFTLENVPANAILQISYIGYLPQEITVNNQSSYNIMLKEDNQSLDEVVVVGYGTVRKADLAGSVAVLDNKAFKDQPITVSFVKVV